MIIMRQFMNSRVIRAMRALTAAAGFILAANAVADADEIERSKHESKRPARVLLHAARVFDGINVHPFHHIDARSGAPHNRE